MDVKDRINKYIEFKGINVFSFEKSIGCSNGYWRKTKSISANILSEITRVYPDLSIDWVITGNGSIFRSDKSQTIKDRLRIFIEYHGLTESDFHKSINMSLSHYNGIEKELSEKELKDIQERYPRLSIYWLMTGEGAMYRKMRPINDRILIIANKMFNEDPFEMCKTIGIDQSVMIPILANDNDPSTDIINLFIEKTEVSSDWLLYSKGPVFKSGRPYFSTNFIEEGTPLLPIEAWGGSLTGSSIAILAEQCKKYNVPISNIDYLIPIAGDSMMPDYCPGDIVGIKKVNEKAFIEWGKVYVLDTCNGVVIKEVQPSENEGCITCISHNMPERYRPFDVSLSPEDFYGMYAVKGTVRIS